MRPVGHWTVKAGLGAGLLAGSWWALSRESWQRLDVRVGEGLRRLGSPPVDRVVSTTTELGSVYAVIGTAGALALTGRRRAAGDTLAVGLTAWTLAQATKTGVGRARPYEADGVRRLVQMPLGTSFPSGHAAVGAAVAALLAEQTPSPAGRVGLRLLGAYVAATRVHVGVHYPTDVLGGAGLGLVLGSVWKVVLRPLGDWAARRRDGVRAGGAPAADR